MKKEGLVLSAPLLVSKRPKRDRGPLESSVANAVRLALSAEGCALWRNNVGLAIHEGRRVKYGLQKGSADLVGIAPGGRFLSVETKRAKGGLVAYEQELWMLLVRQRGGIAMITNSAEDAVAQLRAALDAYREAALPQPTIPGASQCQWCGQWPCECVGG